MNDRVRNILEATLRMDYFGTANADLIALLPLAVAEFADLKTYLERLEQAGISKTSADSLGKNETRSKAVIVKEIYNMLRALARTAVVLQKKNPAFENTYTLPADKMSVQQTLEKARAAHLSTGSGGIEKSFTGLGIPLDFRANLLGNIAAVEQKGAGQSNAKRSSVGETANVEAILQDILDSRATLDVIMRNLFGGNPQKFAEWLTASHIERAAKRTPTPKPPAV